MISVPLVLIKRCTHLVCLCLQAVKQELNAAGSTSRWRGKCTKAHLKLCFEQCIEWCQVVKEVRKDVCFHTCQSH